MLPDRKLLLRSLFDLTCSRAQRKGVKYRKASGSITAAITIPFRVCWVYTMFGFHVCGLLWSTAAQYLLVPLQGYWTVWSGCKGELLVCFHLRRTCWTLYLLGARWPDYICQLHRIVHGTAPSLVRQQIKPVPFSNLRTTRGSESSMGILQLPSCRTTAHRQSFPPYLVRS